MNKKIKIIFFSGSRAEYNIQYPVIKFFKKEKKIKSYLIVSGSHTSNVVGDTKKFITKDSIKIFKELKINLKSEKNEELVEYCLKLKNRFIKELLKIKPDYIFLTSDRFETLAIAEVSHLLRIPIIHLEGGDNTEGGVLDDNIRHVITKFSNLHLTTNDDSYTRVIKLGEQKKYVYKIGFPPLLEAKKNLIKFEELQKIFNFNSNQFIFLVTLHPVPSEKKIADDFFKIINFLKKNKKYFFIITYPNFDPGYKKIISKLKKIKKNQNVFITKSLGRVKFYSILKYIGTNKAGCCVGNSSSFIKETKIFNVPVILIGDRQKGRLMNDNVFILKNLKNKNFLNAVSKISKKKLKKHDIYFDKTNKKINNFIKVLLKLNPKEIYKKKLCY